VASRCAELEASLAATQAAAAQRGAALEASVDARLDACEARLAAAVSSRDAQQQDISTKLDSTSSSMRQDLEQLQERLSVVHTSGEQSRAAATALETRITELAENIACELRPLNEGSELLDRRLAEVDAFQSRLEERAQGISDLGSGLARMEQDLAALQEHSTELQRLGEERQGVVLSLSQQLAQVDDASEGVIAGFAHRVDDGLRQASEQAAAALAAVDRFNTVAGAEFDGFRGLLGNMEVRLDAKIHKLLEQQLRKNLEAADRPLMADIAAMKQQAAEAAEELRKLAEVSRQNDSIWTSLAQLAARLEEMQLDVDRLAGAATGGHGCPKTR